VGIGASAGGLEALTELFRHLPDDTGMAFVVIQHLSPNFKSLMNELLQKHTKMAIKVPREEGIPLEPNTIYLNSRDKILILKNGKVAFEALDPASRFTLPIDDFFHSLGMEYKVKSIAVILSGSGSDGSRGLRTIKESGGIIMVQAANSAQFDGMPLSALKMGLEDFQGTPEEIAANIVHLGLSENQYSRVTFNPRHFGHILDLVHNASNVDFHQYKEATLQRRILKRMDMLHIQHYLDYAQYLEEDKEERETLFREFLIGVTHFFRDPQAFEVLQSKVLPNLVKSSKNKQIRVWVAGCSTGEEAYTLAMLLDKAIQDAGIVKEFKIFATDVDQNALDVAMLGIYPKSIQEDIPKDFLQEYMTFEGHTFRIKKEIRNCLVFSNHNILNDPPFINLDLVSCRNLLIYLTPESQQQVIALFQYALRRGGALLLGKSESLGGHKASFEIVDTALRIYRSTGDETLIKRYLRSSRVQSRNPLHGIDSTGSSPQNRGAKEAAFYKRLSEYYAPPLMIIDQNMEVVFSRGNTRPFLQIGEGMFSSNVGQMFTDKVLGIIRNGIRKSQKDLGTVKFSQVKPDSGPEEQGYDLVFRSYEEDGNLFTVLEFHLTEGTVTAEDEASVTLVDVNLNQQIQALEDDLQSEKEEKQQIIEELETSNEELQASNEELLSSNEELQSTNEELQSVNEELHSVNAELQMRNDELAVLNKDMDNLLISTKIGVLFLDPEFLIRKFTPEVQTLFRVKESDIGRPIQDLASYFVDMSQKDFLGLLEEVLKTGEILSRKVDASAGALFFMRILPFDNGKGDINGILVTFMDISELEEMRNRLSTNEHRLNLAFEVGKIAWWSWDIPQNIVQFDPRKAKMIGYQPEEIGPGYQGFTAHLHPEDKGATMEAMEKALQGEAPYYQATYRLKTKDEVYRWFRDRGEILQRDSDGHPTEMVGVVFDVDTAMSLQKERDELQVDFDALFQHMSHGAVVQDSTGRIILANPAAEDILSLGTQELARRDADSPEWKAIKEDGTPFPGEEFPGMVCLRTGKDVDRVMMGLWDKKSEDHRWIRVSSRALRGASGETVEKVFTIFEDFSSVKKTQDQLKQYLKTKDDLFKESHHRIKNNLQMIIGLLNLQGNFNESTGEGAIEQTISRIKSISLIHELLYQKQDADDLMIDPRVYFPRLIDSVVALEENEGIWGLDFDITADRIAEEKAIPCGMILTELFQNSLKYGRPKKGKAKASLKFLLDEDHYSLEYRDNGPGLAEDFEPGEGLGTQLLEAFAMQLDGSLVQHPTGGQGVYYTLKFPQK
jgi:two-component system CheB/CheR fusion protein